MSDRPTELDRAGSSAEVDRPAAIDTSAASDTSAPIRTSALTGTAYLQRLLGGQVQPPASAGAATPQLAWLKALRAEAVERAGALKLPTRRDEAWRFTDISPLLTHAFQPLRTPTVLDLAAIEPFAIDEATTRLVFVDGAYAPALSSRSAAGTDGLVVGTLAGASAETASLIEPHLGRHAGTGRDLFAALNTAFLHDAAIVVVPPDAAIAAPLHLLFISTQAEVASHPRVMLVAESGSSVSLIEDYVALHDGAYFTNAVAEIAVGAGARVDHVRVQREAGAAFHIGRCAVSLARGGRYHSVSIALGARMSRLGLDVHQTGDATECTLDGLALIGQRQLADTHTFIDHAQPHGVSRQLHKCIVDDASHAVFSGNVMVRPGAQRTDSAQSSRNLLLTTKATVDTMPQLEIFADDVKCTHGATVGELDREEVFYLRSRGLDEAAAKKLLTYAFGAEVIDRIPVASLRRRLEQTVLEQTRRSS